MPTVPIVSLDAPFFILAARARVGQTREPSGRRRKLDMGARASEKPNLTVTVGGGFQSQNSA